MRKGRLGILVLILMGLMLFSAVFGAVPVGAAANYEVAYTTCADWGLGFNGNIVIKNRGAQPLLHWKLEFDWGREITSIWKARIMSRENHHYIITGEVWDRDIPAGESVSFGFLGNPGGVGDGPAGMTVTDLDDEIAAKAAAWDQYRGMKEGEAISKSFAELMFYYYTRFEADVLYPTGYKHIETNPVTEFIEKRFQNVEVPTQDGLKLKGLFFPVFRAKGTLVALHGHGDDMYNTLRNIEFLIDNGYQVLLFNGRFWNYYKNPQTFTGSVVNDTADIMAAVDYLKSRPDVARDKIGLIGFSHGACKALLAASYDEDVKLLIMEGGSAFSFFDEEAIAICKNSPPGWFYLRNEVIDLFCQRMSCTVEDIRNYDYVLRMSAVHKPLLLLYGMQDPYVNPEEGARFYSLAPGPKEFYTFPNAGHCNAVFTADREDYIRKVTEFLERYMR